MPFLVYLRIHRGKGGKGKIMAEFKTIETQEELERILGERLTREKEKASKVEESLKNEIADLKKSIEDSQTKYAQQQEQLNSHNEEVAKLTAELTAQTLKATKHQIAYEYGLPFELADRLTGEDEESLKKDAETLKKFVTPKKAPPLANPEKPPEEGTAAAYRELAKKFTK